MLVGVFQAFPGEGSCHWFLLCVDQREFTKHRKENSVKTQTYPFSCFSLNLDLQREKKKKISVIQGSFHQRKSPLPFYFPAGQWMYLWPMQQHRNGLSWEQQPKFQSVTEWLGLEGTFKDHLAQPPADSLWAKLFKNKNKTLKNHKSKELFWTGCLKQWEPKPPEHEEKIFTVKLRNDRILWAEAEVWNVFHCFPKIHHREEWAVKIPKYSLTIHQGNPSKTWGLAQQWLKSPWTEIKLQPIEGNEVALSLRGWGKVNSQQKSLFPMDN